MNIELEITCRECANAPVKRNGSIILKPSPENQKPCVYEFVEQLTMYPSIDVYRCPSCGHCIGVKASTACHDLSRDFKMVK